MCIRDGHRTHIWTLALTTVLLLLPAAPASAGVVVRFGTCDSNSGGFKDEICAEDPRYVGPQTWYSGSSGSVVAGGFAGPTSVGAYVKNTAGGSARVTANFWDDYTLHGKGTDPITVQASLHVDGERSDTSDGAFSSVAVGFLLPGGGAYYPSPGSVALPDLVGSTGEIVDVYAMIEFELAPGESRSLGIQIDILGTGDTLNDFMSTAELAFPDLPAGYYVSSTQGFDGVGSQPGGPDQQVLLPSSFLLALLGLANLGPSILRRRRGAG